jgi:hypothetical protein
MAQVGDRIGTASVSSQIAMTGVLDIVGGLIWLVPFVGVVAPGFWDLDRSEVTIWIPDGEEER